MENESKAEPGEKLGERENEGKTEPGEMGNEDNHRISGAVRLRLFHIRPRRLNSFTDFPASLPLSKQIDASFTNSTFIQEVLPEMGCYPKFERKGSDLSRRKLAMNT